MLSSRYLAPIVFALLAHPGLAQDPAGTASSSAGQPALGSVAGLNGFVENRGQWPDEVFFFARAHAAAAGERAGGGGSSSRCGARAVARGRRLPFEGAGDFTRTACAVAAR